MNVRAGCDVDYVVRVRCCSCRLVRSATCRVLYAENHRAATVGSSPTIGEPWRSCSHTAGTTTDGHSRLPHQVSQIFRHNVERHENKSCSPLRPLQDISREFPRALDVGAHAGHIYRAICEKVLLVGVCLIGERHSGFSTCTVMYCKNMVPFASLSLFQCDHHAAISGKAVGLSPFPFHWHKQRGLRVSSSPKLRCVSFFDTVFFLLETLVPNLAIGENAIHRRSPTAQMHHQGAFRSPDVTNTASNELKSSPTGKMYSICVISKQPLS